MFLVRSFGVLFLSFWRRPNVWWTYISHYWIFVPDSVFVVVSVSCRCKLVKNKQMSTNEWNLRMAGDGSGGDVDVGVSQRSEQSVSLATVRVGRPLPSPVQTWLLFGAAVKSLVGDWGVESLVRDFDTLRHRRKLRNEKRRRNSSNGLSASALRTLPLPPQSGLSEEEKKVVVGGTIKLFDLCLRFCFFDFDDCGDNGGGGDECDPVGDRLHTSEFCTEFLLDFRRKLMVSSFFFFFQFLINLNVYQLELIVSRCTEKSILLMQRRMKNCS